MFSNQCGSIVHLATMSGRLNQVRANDKQSETTPNSTPTTSTSAKKANEGNKMSTNGGNTTGDPDEPIPPPHVIAKLQDLKRVLDDMLVLGVQLIYDQEAIQEQCDLLTGGSTERIEDDRQGQLDIMLQDLEDKIMNIQTGFKELTQLRATMAVLHKQTRVMRNFSRQTDGTELVDPGTVPQAAKFTGTNVKGPGPGDLTASNSSHAKSPRTSLVGGTPHKKMIDWGTFGYEGTGNDRDMQIIRAFREREEYDLDQVCDVMLRHLSHLKVSREDTMWMLKTEEHNAERSLLRPFGSAQFDMFIMRAAAKVGARYKYSTNAANRYLPASSALYNDDDPSSKNLATLREKLI